MSPVLFLVWIAMSVLAPERDHTLTAAAVTRVVLEEPPLFKNDESRLRTASLIVAIAFRESSFRNDAASRTNDHCLMQINRRPDLAKDVDACLHVAFTMLRESFRACPEHLIAFYAEGPKGCESARAQRISRDRLGLARRILPASVSP